MVREPQSMDELIYFTQRAVGPGNAKAWVYRGDCPKCGKAKMGKPTGPGGKVKIRAKEYVCPACNYTVEKKEYEDTLHCEIRYVCPSCKYSGEITVPYRRKKFDGMDAIVFLCEKCKTKIPVTKKLKEKGEPSEAADDS